MQTSEWLALAGILLTAIFGGGAWMFRMDRGLSRLEAKIDAKLEGLQEWKIGSQSDRAHLWERVNELRHDYHAHESRLTRLETLHTENRGNRSEAQSVESSRSSRKSGSHD